MWDGFVQLLELVFSNFLTVIFIFLILMPILARQQRHGDLVRAFSKLQKKRQSQIITLVHRIESMGFLGIPRFGYIDLNDAEEVIAAIRATPDDKPLEIMMHTPGGLVLAALQIARAVKAHPGPTRVFIPHFAMSGGTMIALAADEIVMTDHAIMGPIDPQIDGWPAAAFVRLREAKSIDATSDDTLLLAEMSEMAIAQVTDAARELLSGTVSDNAANAIAEQLATGKWNHDYPIYAHEARELGLHVTTDMPQDFMNLMTLFPNTMRNRSGVRYLASRIFGGGSQRSGVHAGAQQGAPYNGGHHGGVGGGSLGGGTALGGGDSLPGNIVARGRAGRQISFGPWNPNDVETTGQIPPLDNSQRAGRRKS